MHLFVTLSLFTVIIFNLIAQNDTNMTTAFKFNFR